MFDAPADDESARTQVDRERLLRALADGRRHAWDALARAVFDRCTSSDIACLRTTLASAPWPDTGLVMDDLGVRATPFVLLDADRMADRLGGRWRVAVISETTSTNTDLLAEVRARPDLPLPTLLAAEIQRSGRGRLGRRWQSSPGASLTVSFAVRVARRVAQLDGVTLVCGLAVRHALASLGIDAGLKWPNDVLVAGRKVAGILVEAHARPAGTVLVIGVGINVRVPVAGRAAIDASSLPWGGLAETGASPIDRNGLIAALALALEEHVARFDRDGFDAFVSAWNDADAYRDHAVALQGATATTARGVERGVDASGALWLERGGLRERFVAGEVSLRADVEQPA